MPSFLDLQFVSTSTIAIGLIITAASVVLVSDWRLALFALTIQYVLLAAVLASFVQPSVAGVRIISGVLSVSILFLTMRSRDQKGKAARSTEGPSNSLDVFIVGFPFRLFAVALAAVAIIGLVSTVSFLGLPEFVFFSSIWLLAIGLLIAMLSRDALRLGFGILIFTAGFTVIDTAIEGSLFLYGLLNIADLLIALLVAHLATLPSDIGRGQRRGDLL